MLSTILLLIIGVSWVYWIIAWWMTRELFLHPLEVDGRFTPPVSILKPVKGVDAQAYQNFASFCCQDYLEYELVFGVADSDDPVIPLIERLRRDFPHHPVRLIVSPPTIGANQKASLLDFLASQAHYEILAISDSDMRVTPDYLKKVVAPLANRAIGLVTCPYRGENPQTLTARLEALYMGIAFLPSVIVASKVFKMGFAMGSTAVVRKTDLTRIGGFAAIADYLADDYELGARIADLGLQVHLSDYVVASLLGATTFQEQWDREVRWMHCTRISRPWEYPGLLLSFSTPLSVLLLLFSPLELRSWLVFTTSIFLRWSVGWMVSGYSEDRQSRQWLFWLPMRDMLSALIWSAGILGRKITWRGETFLLNSNGKLVSLSTFIHEPDQRAP